MLKSSALVILFTISFTNCQFFYNYEEQGADEPQIGSQDDPSMYQYNPPAAVNQQFLQPRSQPEELGQNGRARTRIRVRSRNYQSETDYAEAQPETKPETDQRALRQQRRQERKEQRQAENIYVQPIQTPRVYSPSVFQNVQLGEAPSGVYVPNDSFLNVLKSSSRRAETPAYQSIPVVPQTNSYVQPAVSYVANEPRQRFFVQPPSNEDTRQSNLILPVVQPVIDTPSRQTIDHRSSSPSVQGRAVGTVRRTRQRPRVEPIRGPPTVDIDSYRNDMAREPVQVTPQVEYYTPPERQETRPSQNRRRTITRYQETTPARVYSPSIFDKISLGEAPSGIYVPEDSLLNVLRNPSSRRQVAYQTQQVQPQPIYHQANDQNDYIPEEIEEEQYLPPPPPPPPSRRQSSQRSRQTSTSRRSGHRRQQNEPEEQVVVQPVRSSQSQQRDDNYDDFVRQPKPRQQTQPQRRRQEVAPSRPQPQPSSSGRGENFRKAKLAIAELPLDTDDDGIPGEAGVNYPTLHVIPRTAFSCSEQPHNGYYADLETSCQVVHLCQSGGVQNSFLCPNGTIWNQEKFSCQWWYKVNCSDSPKFYIKNDELYKVPEKPERKRN